ncbi:penicillin-binding protein [Candidatus Gracilibacteria bacterium]|jgi:membrane peptidoglycan carboxypeptidase|nr:penicillin-binding protein [Candidatus Gracilibacteria bacterium]
MYSENRKNNIKKSLKRHYGNYRQNLSSSAQNTKEKLLLLITSIVTACFVAGTAIFFLFSLFLPSVGSIENFLGKNSIEMFDINGKRLYSTAQNQIREPIPLEEIPENLRLATIAIEDDSFYEHNGFDFGGIIKAFLSELGIGPRRGGSTITQQLVKNTFLTSERTFTRKAKELILATRVERRFSKDKILEMYLNQIPYGGRTYGIEQASDLVFNKDAKDLTLAESAILASLPQLPTYYSPFGDHRYASLAREIPSEEARKIDSVKDLDETDIQNGLIGQNYKLTSGQTIYIPGRADLVLSRMEKLGFIEEEEQEQAIKETNNISFNQNYSANKAEHFGNYIKDFLTEEFGTDLVESGGLKVYTTLNLDAQREAEKLVSEAAAINTKQRDAGNMSLLAIENKTGHIVAMVGSAGYTNEEIDGYVNIVTSKRQSGSSFKPFAYAAMMLSGYGAGSVLWDVPTEFGDYKPKNFDGGFTGPLTVRRALAQSRNIPAIKAYFLGGEQGSIIDMVSKMGIYNLDKTADYGPPLALGGGEITQLELTHAYSAFAQTGKQAPLEAIIRVEDRKGNILYESDKEPKLNQVLDPEVAFIIADILSDRKNNLGSNLNISNRPTAIKTGTSTSRIKAANGNPLPNDAWAVGFTPQYTVSVWSGNNNRPMGPNGEGYSNSAPTFGKFMNYIHQLNDIPPTAFSKPEGIKSVSVSKFSGFLPGESTPKDMVVSDYFPSFGVPDKVDNSFTVVAVDSRNGLLANDSCPQEYVKDGFFVNPQTELERFENWSQGIYSWLTSSNQDQATLPENLSDLDILMGKQNQNLIYYRPIPQEESPLCDGIAVENEPEIRITSPANRSNMGYGVHEILVETAAANGIDRVEFYLGDNLQFTSRVSPYKGKVRVTQAFEANKVYDITAKVIDESGFSKKTKIKVKIGSQPFSETETNETEQPPVNNQENNEFLPFEDQITNQSLNEGGPVINVTPF